MKMFKKLKKKIVFFLSRTMIGASVPYMAQPHAGPFFPPNQMPPSQSPLLWRFRSLLYRWNEPRNHHSNGRFPFLHPNSRKSSSPSLSSSSSSSSLCVRAFWLFGEQCRTCAGLHVSKLFFLRFSLFFFSHCTCVYILLTLSVLFSRIRPLSSLLYRLIVSQARTHDEGL